MPDRLHVVISGRVQGVGFRYTVCSQAEALRLNGWVRNVPDGCVEAEFEGPKEALEAMLAWCREGPLLARVQDVQVTWDSSPAARYSDFRIRGW